MVCNIMPWDVKLPYIIIVLRKPSLIAYFGAIAETLSISPEKIFFFEARGISLSNKLNYQLRTNISTKVPNESTENQTQNSQTNPSEFFYDLSRKELNIWLSYFQKMNNLLYNSPIKQHILQVYTYKFRICNFNS